MFYNYWVTTFRKVLYFSLASVSIFSAQAVEACGTGGTLAYSSGSLYYCNGSAWVNTKNTSVTACAAGDAGLIRYQSGEYQFCDGTDWFSTKGIVATACAASEAGAQRYSSSKMQVCDGTDWYDMYSAPAASISFTGSAASTTDATSYTYTAVALDSLTGSDRYVLVGTSARSAATTNITSMTIGGVAATELVDHVVSTSNCGFYIAQVPTGTTADIVVNYSGTMVRSGVTVWTLRGLVSITPHHTRTGTTTGALNVPANGVAAGVFYNSTLANHAWTGLTKNIQYGMVDNIDGQGGGASQAFVAAEAGRTVSVATTTNVPALCSISFR